MLLPFGADNAMTHSPSLPLNRQKLVLPVPSHCSLCSSTFKFPTNYWVKIYGFAADAVAFDCYTVVGYCSSPDKIEKKSCRDTNY